MTAAQRPLHRRPVALALVFVGGAVGTAARYAVSELVPHQSTEWPWGTFAVNVVGSFVLGLLLHSLLRAGPDSGVRLRMRLLLGTGFCGGFTTYSTFALETTRLLQNGTPGTGLAYAAVSVLAGAGAAFLGIAAAGTAESRGAR